jgi:RNA polymerase sigma-70 factor (ECF subfamily)
MTTAATELTDERLVAGTRAGDDEAFAALVGRHKRRVFGIAARFARHSQELDDLAQEIFLKAHRKLARFRGDAPFEHWLARIAVRCCYDLLRKTRREGVHVPVDSLELEAAENSEAERAHEVLAFGLSRLGPAERLVITLLELEEKSVREVAELTGWSEGNVKVRAHRARQALKRVLEQSHAW